MAKQAADITSVQKLNDLFKIVYADRLERLIPDSIKICLLYTSPSPRDRQKSRMPSSA